MRIPRTPRQLLRAALDLAIVGTVLSGLVAIVARFFGTSRDAHELFVIGFSATILACVALLVLAVVVRTIEVGGRPD